MARCQELLNARNSPGASPEVLKRINLIMGATSMETLDSQNRIKLNPKMTSQVGIRPAVKSAEGRNQSSLIVVGGADCLEIWDECEYDRAAAEVISNADLVV
jgi:DNA-binding transcriptional regulator/RsmH inhibitor MraZ